MKRTLSKKFQEKLTRLEQRSGEKGNAQSLKGGSTAQKGGLNCATGRLTLAARSIREPRGKDKKGKNTRENQEIQGDALATILEVKRSRGGTTKFRRRKIGGTREKNKRMPPIKWLEYKEDNRKARKELKSNQV